jgi:Leucine-rich repeat (LRR) protein
MPVYLLLLAALVSDTDWITHAGGVVRQDSSGKLIAADLRSSWITDSDMFRLAQMPALRKLDLSLTRISDRGLRALHKAPAIEELNLYFAEQITDDGLSAIRSWKRLKRLNLRGAKITDTTLEFLAGIPTLESLDIGYAQITDAGLAFLASLTNLRELTIGGNKLAGPGLQSLRQLPHLTYLDLGGSQRTDSGLWSITVTEAGLEAVQAIADLKELRLVGTSVAAGGIALLKDLAHLELLDLQGCKRVGDDAVGALSSLKQLRRLDLHGTSITAQGVAKLRGALPQTAILTPELP